MAATLRFQKGAEVMKIDNYNNRLTLEPVALKLPNVAPMLPCRCPSAAGGLPACYLQVADRLP